MLSALSTSLRAEDECNIVDPGPEDLTSTWVDWMPGADDTLQPQLALRALAREDLAYEIEARVNFGGEDLSWEQGPYLLYSTESTFIDIEIPTEALMDARQLDYLSTLVVLLTAYDTSTGETIQRLSAPPLKLYYPSLLAEPTLLDLATADEVAPGGVVSSALREELSSALDRLGYIVEIAPQP